MPIIPSSPTTFTAISGSPQTVTFAIPAGTYASGTWYVNSTAAFASGTAVDNIGTNSNTHIVTENFSAAPTAYTLALSSNQIADVNAAAGGNLTVTFEWLVSGSFGNQHVLSFTLTLVGSVTPPGNGYPNPEWGYGFQVATPLTAINLATPAGGVGISNSGTNASPAALTSVFDFSLTMGNIVSGIVTNISYAGTSITMDVDTSPDNATWTNQYSVSIGSDHTGTFQDEQISYTFGAQQNAVYLRLSFQEVPQVAAASLMLISNLEVNDTNGLIIGAGSGFCNNTGTFTISGQITWGDFGISYTPREKLPLTMLVKHCTNPNVKMCAHGSGTTPPGTPCNPWPWSMYCSDGVISAQYTTTDCNGNYTFTASGCVLAVAIGIGTFIPNPNFSCSQPEDTCTTPPAQYGGWQFIPDATTASWISECGGSNAFSASGGNGTAIGSLGTGCVGDLLIGSVGSQISDAAGGDGGLGGLTPCYTIDASYSGFGCLTCDGNGNLGVYYATAAYNVIFPGEEFVSYNLEGSYTLNFYSGYGAVNPYVYYVADGLYFEVQGVYTTYTDSCGKTSTNLPSPSNTGFDWTQFVSVAVSNWTPDCSPPINVNFTGPLGGTLKVLPGTKVPRIGIQSNIYPVYDGKLPTLCPQDEPVVGIQVQSPCLSTVGEVLQADTLHDVLALSWVTTGGALYTAINRQATQKKIRTYGSELWNMVDQVESINTSEVGMVFLPNQSLYLTYELSSTPVYRINQLLGTEGYWSSTLTPSPLTSLISDGGRAQGQAYRVQALGSLSTDGILQFSQCRDGLGATWTTPVTITNYAAGPYAGICYTGNQYIVIFSLSSGTSHGIANGMYWTNSTDGGATWSAPSFLGYTGQCNGICATHQNALNAVVVSGPSMSGFYSTQVLQSLDNGVHWAEVGVFGNVVPALKQPPCIASFQDNVFICWVSGNTPQYVMSTDGGTTYL